MSRDKQIEEIACDLCECMPYVVCDENLHTCESCKNKEMAEYLYNAGYRKASDVAREIFAEIERQLNDFNGSWADTVINTQYLIAELKKKYITEEGKWKLSE